MPLPVPAGPYDGPVGQHVEVIVGAAAGVVVLAGLLVRWLARRALVRRIDAVGARLGHGHLGSGRRGLEAALDRLEQAAGLAVADVGRAADEVERLRRALGTLAQGVVVCDEQGEVVFRNERADLLVGERHADVLARQEVDGLLRATLAGEEQVRTLELYGPPRRTLTLTGVGLDDGARVVGGAVVIDDVSERRRLEAMRRDFVTNISHELKTPVGALALLSETLAGEDDPVVSRRLAERMHAEAFRVARVIEDLLDLSRIEAEEAPVREPVPVHLVMGEAVERARAAAELRHVRVDVTEPPRRHTIMGDRRQLVSALFNLVENAVKYSEPGAQVEVVSRTDGAWVDLVVRDHGIGIPTRDLERIFERFYRVDRGRGRDTGGTGLGLAIVRHVATNHGGEVRVESLEGDGSTFVLHLPAGPGPVVVTATAEAG
jgi:two-component system, OmpR family, sensor histidine kinase SenX3